MVSLGPAHERRVSGISREPAPAIVFRRGGLDDAWPAIRRRSFVRRVSMVGLMAPNKGAVSSGLLKHRPSGCRLDQPLHAAASGPPGTAW
jgi:hypothetical protein